MTWTTTRALVAAALVALWAAPAAAQRRELQQLAADVRILQEQTQLLQNSVTALTDALKAVNARIDEQTSVTRKALADAKLQADAVGSDVRVVRERVDDTNVRITSLSQEVEALRLAIPPMSVLVPQTDTTAAGASPPESAGATPAPGTAPPPSTTPAPATPTAPAGSGTAAPPVPAGVSPTRLYDMAWADYTAGSYDLAIEGFSSYVRTFPRSEFADNAQYYIGASYFQRGKYPEAVDAYARVIANYPKGDVAAQAHYQRALCYEKMNQPDRAREGYEFVIKAQPDSDAGRLAKQRLDGLNRARPPQ